MDTNRERDIDTLTRELNALTFRTRQIEEELQTLRSQDTSGSTNEPIVVFTAGDKVTIINQVRKPRTWTGAWDPTAIIAERRATVTHTVGDQVWIVTGNGTETWRLSTNLQRRNDE